MREFIVVHTPEGAPFFVARAHIVCFGDKWLTLTSQVQDEAVKESIEELARMLSLTA